jgi:hypothetical protein
MTSSILNVDAIGFTDSVLEEAGTNEGKGAIPDMWRRSRLRPRTRGSVGPRGRPALGGVSRSLSWRGDRARLLKHVPCSVTPTLVFVLAVDTKSGHTIECVRTRGSSIRSSPTSSLRVDQSDRLGQPIRPVIQRMPQKPKTSSSGGIPLELVDLGLL